jgi:transposase
LVRVTGVAPIDATVYEFERLRCNLCGEVFTADRPEGVGEEKYDLKARAMIILLKYGCGLPFNRLAKLEASLGIPLPASTQWDLVLPIAENLMPVYTEFIRQAAQGKVLYNDDTTARILKLKGVKNGPYVIEDDDIDEKRTGIFTTGIVASVDGTACSASSLPAFLPLAGVVSFMLFAETDLRFFNQREKQKSP